MQMRGCPTEVDESEAHKMQIMQSVFMLDVH